MITRILSDPIIITRILSDPIKITRVLSDPIIVTRILFDPIIITRILSYYEFSFFVVKKSKMSFTCNSFHCRQK